MADQSLQQQIGQVQEQQITTAQQVSDMMAAFWTGQMQEMERGNLDFKFHQLPLARIKKVMKSDEDVKMISGEAPIIFSKACEIFILELTLRAWIHTEENKRRTLQKSDVSAAISRADLYDCRKALLEDMSTNFQYFQNNNPTNFLTPEQQALLSHYQQIAAQNSLQDFRLNAELQGNEENEQQDETEEQAE